MSLLLLSRRGGGVLEAAPAIAVTPSASAVTIAPDGTAAVGFTLARSGGFTGVVTPVAAGLPSGVTASFSPSTFGAGVTSMTMTLTAVAAPLVTNDAFAVTFSGSGVSNAVYNGTVTVQAVGAWAANLSTLGTGWTLHTDQVLGTINNGWSYVNYEYSGQGPTPGGSAPYSGGYFESVYAGGVYSGVGGAIIEGPQRTSDQEMYACFNVYFSSDYRLHTGNEKLWYAPTTADPLILNLYSESANQYAMIGYRRPGDAFDPANGVSNPPTMGRGTWNTVEIYGKMNTSGTENGILKVWINGTIQIDRADWQFITSGGGFSGPRYDGTKGGGTDGNGSLPAGTFRRYNRCTYYHR